MTSSATRVEILGVGVDAQSFADAITTLTSWAREATGRTVSTCPVYTLMQAVEQPPVRAALDRAAMVSADGMPLVWLQRRRGFPQAERVYGPDILLALCAQPGLRHFFLGGDVGVADQLAKSLTARFPGLQIAGTLAPQVTDLAVDGALVESIRQAAPNIVWVGLGSPKQDLWMDAYREALPVLRIGVGAAFDFVSGNKRQAPRWIRERGLEWLFRLIQEPNRLWKRYLVYNMGFLWAILNESVTRPKNRP